MPITQFYNPNAALVGQAAYDIGFGEYVRQQEAEALRQAQFAEQQRQFEAELALQQERLFADTSLRERSLAADTSLRERGLAADISDNEFRRRLAGEELRNRRAALQVGAAQSEADRAAQLMGLDIQGQYGLADQQLRNQAALEAEAMQQAGLGARQQQQLGGQFGMQFQAQAARQMQADWQNIQKVLPRLDQDERDELLGKFQERWQNANIPMPVELPSTELPEWMDPNAQWEKANQYAAQQAQMGNSIMFVPDENGMPQIVRGQPSYTQTPQGIQQQHEFELEKERIKNEEKQRIEAEQAEIKLRQETEKLQQQQAHQQELARIREQNQLLTARASAAKAIIDLHQRKAQLAAEASIEPVEGMPRIDNSQAIAEIDRIIESLKRDMGGLQQPSQPPAANGGPVLVTNRAELEALPVGTPFILPDGRTGTRQ